MMTYLECMPLYDLCTEDIDSMLTHDEQYADARHACYA